MPEYLAYYSSHNDGWSQKRSLRHMPSAYAISYSSCDR